MTARRLLVLLGCATAAGVAVAVLWSRVPRDPVTAASGGGLKVASPAALPTPKARSLAAERFAEALSVLARVKVGAAGAPARLRSGEILAHVNGTPILGRDLLPFADQSVEEKSVSPEMYAYLLERGISREVTFQEARRLGVELGAEQRRQLQPPAQVDDAAQAAFDRRDAEYQLLLSALAERAGVPSPFATQGDVEAYYRDHAAEFAAVPDRTKDPAAWNAIQLSIRATLADERMATHGAGLQDLLATLKGAAEIRPN